MKVEFLQDQNELDKDISVITNLKENQAIRVPNGGQSLRDFLDLKAEDSQPLVIFDLKGNYKML